MILTEEQKRALKRVVAYMDEMYAIASPYYGCTEDADLLRAMINSSEHFTNATKMIGFDLERARGLRDFLQDDCAEVGDVWAEMIAEIERLQSRLDESEQILAHKTKTATHWYEEGLKTRADLVQSKRVVEQQAARIAELEDALVEERASRVYYEDSCPFRLWNDIKLKDKFLEKARLELLDDGKIGPDADAKPRVWQITEERKDALMAMMSLRIGICCPMCDAWLRFSDVTEYVPVLRAMLTEVGQ